MSMKILQHFQTPEELEEDMPELLEMHKIALEEEITWPFFGGVITCLLYTSDAADE